MTMSSGGDADSFLRDRYREHLEEAHVFLEWTRQHFGPEQEAEVLAEIEFYEWLLALIDHGVPAKELTARPSYGVLRATLDGLDMFVERDRETLPLWQRRGETEKVRAAEARIAKALDLRSYVAAIEPAEGTVETYKPSFDRRRRITEKHDPEPSE